MTYNTYKYSVMEFGMREFIKIETRDVLSFLSDHNNKSSLEIIKKTDIAKPKDDKNLMEEDDTSIYEYDIDCLKKRGYLDHVCNEEER